MLSQLLITSWSQKLQNNVSCKVAESETIALQKLLTVDNVRLGGLEWRKCGYVAEGKLSWAAERRDLAALV